MIRIVCAATATALYFATAFYLQASYVEPDRSILRGPFFRIYGNAFVAYMNPPHGDADTDVYRDRSSLQFFEDGKPLGPAHSAHGDINELGGGRYSHWHNGKTILLFSTSDHSDPNSNGRVYRAIDPSIGR